MTDTTSYTATTSVAAPDLSGVIDLRSDTVTRPTPSMRRAMAEAVVGDDQYGDDPTVNELEAQAAELMGKEAAVFVPSGTMGNLASLLSRCDRGMEAVVGSECHILWYEMSGASALGGIPLMTVPNDRLGQLDLDRVEQAIRQPGATSPVTGLICVENTHNRCGGTVLSMDYLRQLRELSLRRGVPVHMDGARIFNAAAASHIGSKRGSSTLTSGPVVTFSRRYRPSVFSTLMPRAPSSCARLISSPWNWA